MNEQIKRTLKLLPDRPGVYIMKNSGGQIIYVGKAKNLANRVRSYFHSPGGLSVKTRALVETVDNLSYIVLDSELEALLLENNLIKKHKPYYNILLKDDKGYPYLRLDASNPYPSLTVARRLVHDGALYFGPYLGAGLARDIADAVLEQYPLRTCNADIERRKGRMRPCVKYEIGKCAGPCRAGYDERDYAKLVNGVKELFNDSYGNIRELLSQKMYQASLRTDYEKAALYRDRMLQLDKIRQSQKAVLKSSSDLDAVALSVEAGYAVFASLVIRGGKLISVHTDEFPDTASAPEELMEQYLMQKYSPQDIIPPEILLLMECPSMEAVRQHICGIAGHAVNIHVPKRGEKAAIMRLAQENSGEVLAKSVKAELARRERVLAGLSQLKELLNLDRLPRRIECFDISHIQGTDTVASMVVLTDGAPEPRQYRRFKIKTVEGNNDFASMAEVISRRFSRAAAASSEGDSFAVLPDLLVIDGGKGQLSSAMEVLRGMGMNLNVIGLAKRMEEIYLPDEPLPIAPGLSSPAVRLLQVVRDEAHRFAITYHRSLRGKRGLLSQLDAIPGIGEKRKRALFKKYGSVESIRAASAEELAGVQGMNASSARAVAEFFAAKHGNVGPESTEGAAGGA